MKLTRTEINEWADSRETSFAIAEAICDVAKNDDEMQRIWDSPTEKQINIVVDYAFKITGEDELFWGVEVYERGCFYRIEEEIEITQKQITQKQRKMIKDFYGLSRLKIDSDGYAYGIKINESNPEMVGHYVTIDHVCIILNEIDDYKEATNSNNLKGLNDVEATRVYCK